MHVTKQCKKCKYFNTQYVKKYGVGKGRRSQQKKITDKKTTTKTVSSYNLIPYHFHAKPI